MQEEQKVYILTDGTPDKTFRGSRVIAAGSVEKLNIYKGILIDNGYEDIFYIEEKTGGAWQVALESYGYQLISYRGAWYPKRNLEASNEWTVTEINKLRRTKIDLMKLRRSFKPEEIISCDVMLSILNDKIIELSGKKLDIILLM